MRRFLAFVFVLSAVAAATSSSALANHSWGNYHWARAANPFTVPLGDNVTNTAYSNWDGALGEESADWTASSVLDSPVVAGGAGNVKRCTTAERHVFCQEVGHGYGLAHQDESGADLNTCMDYSNGLDNPHPNAHDYEQLETIYNSHFDSGGSPAFSPQAGARVGVRRIDRISSSEIVADYGHGYRIVTHITWALGSGS